MAKVNLRLQAKHVAAAKKKNATGHAKGKVFKSPAPRALRIKA